MNSEKQIITIDVQLFDEGIETWRPTQAEVLGNGLYKLLPTPDYDPEDERWEFLPGTIVRTEEKTLYQGTNLVSTLVAVKAD
jgi:hypothetical protein